jgi:ankyrin repeat protein
LHAGGAKLDLPDKDGMTPLKLAGRLGRKDVAKFLRGNGVSEEVETKEEFLAALAAVNLRGARKILSANPGLMNRLTPDDQRILPDAAADNRIWPVRHMLNLGFDINVKGDWGGSAVHQAAWRGHVPMAKFLIARGADLHQKNDFGGEVLGAAVHGAVHAGHRNGLAMILLIARALKIPDLSPHIEWALDDLDPKIVEGLSKAAGVAAKPVRSSPSWKPLMDAAFRGDAAAVRKLLAAGADPNVVSTTAHRYRPLNRAIERKKLTPRGPGHQEVVRVLLEGGTDPKLRGGFGQLTALQQAAQDAPAFIPLLRDRFEPLDIFHATAVGDDRRVEALLKRDPKLATVKDENGRQPLHYCCASATYQLGKAETAALVRIAKLLLKHGAEPNATVATQEKWPLPPLYFCCGAHNNPAVAEVLFKAGAAPFDGETVYHAADEGHRECLELIERYADPKKLAVECTRCIGYQLHWGFSRGAPWLLAHGADPNALREDFGDSALHAAVKARCNDDVIRLILKHGGDPKRKNAAGKSAIDLAARMPRIARLFKSAER